MEPEAEIIRAQLFALQDETYRTFHSALMPTVPPETVIGVRVPALRRLAKQLAGTAQAEVFLQALPHGYYEENNLHAFLIELIRDYDRALAETEAFLPYINNWATCDCFCPKVFAKHKKELLVPIRRWLDSGDAYTVRYGMEMLMRYYLDDAFRPEYLEWVADVRSTEYYINMMRAWYFATALAKQPDAALPWLTEKRLDLWTLHSAQSILAGKSRSHLWHGDGGKHLGLHTQLLQLVGDGQCVHHRCQHPDLIGQSALHLAAGTAAPEVAAANHNADLHAQLMGFLHAAADGVHGGLIKARAFFAAQCFAADLKKDTLIFQCHNPNTACSIFRRGIPRHFYYSLFYNKTCIK